MCTWTLNNGRELCYTSNEPNTIINTILSLDVSFTWRMLQEWSTQNPSMISFTGIGKQQNKYFISGRVTKAFKDFFVILF